MTRIRWVTGAFALAAALLLPTSFAAADSNSTLLTTTLGTTEQPVVQLTLNVAANSDWYLNGFYHAATLYPNTPGPDGILAQPLQSEHITCNGGATPASTVNSTTNVPADGSTSTIRVRDIVTFPSAGTWTCTMWGKTGSGRLAQDGIQPPYLQVLDGTLTATNVTVPYAYGAGRAERWINIAAPGSYGDLAITDSAAHSILAKNWTVAPGYTGFSTRGDVNIDVTSAGSATVQIVLSATQLNSSNNACTGGTNLTSSTSQTVTYETHHRKLYTTLNNIPIASASGCTRKFAIRVNVTRTSGSNIQVDGTDAFGNTYTDAMAMNGNITN